MYFAGYDHDFGIRGKAAIPNAEGITNFKYAFNVDTKTGCRNIQPSNWIDADVATSVSLPLDIDDGNEICFRVRAEDIVGHTNESFVITHVDSSPPEIPFLWLEKDGETNLAVHNSIQLHEMK